MKAKPIASKPDQSGGSEAPNEMMFLLYISYLLSMLANASCIIDVQSGFLPGRAKPCADDGQNDALDFDDSMVWVLPL